ncbi:MAG: RNA-binding protein [Acidobacteria bacterium]|nr:MAG: RNA-binding protein [Acidobacteriota bacterium]
MKSAPPKAFWVPLCCLFAAMVVIAAGIRTPVEPADETLDRPGLALPAFTDITERAGLNMKIICGDEVSEDLQEVNGQGACFLDYNNDGYQDIFLVNGSSRKSEAAGKSPHDYLLRNNGDGTFADVTAQAHLANSGWHSGCAVGDYNNDGFPDLYVTGLGPNPLYRNNGDGSFTEVGESAGVRDPHWGFPKWSMGAAFADYDNDGYLDLYVTNFVKLDPRHPAPRPSQPQACVMKGVPIACPPDDFEGEQAILYHNNRDGTFTDVTRAAGLVRQDPGRGFGAVFGDFDNRGLQDIYQVNDVGPNFFYVNKGDGTFKDASFESGLAVDGYGNPQGTMGVTVGDYNNDGLLDVFIANWIRQNNTLYENQGSHSFADTTLFKGLSHLGYDYCAWGTGFFDFDDDGWLDLWITFGHTNEQIERVYPQDTFAEPNYLLRNLQGKRFVDVSEVAGLGKLKKRSGRGAAFADIDNDGDIDVLVINKNDVPTLLRNDRGNQKNWLAIRTEGVKSNRSGIGARVTVTAGGVRRIFEVRSSESYLSGNDLRVHIGMGDLKLADLIEIRWPSRQVDRYANVAVNAFYLAREGNWLKPDPLVAGRKASRTRNIQAGAQ